jgi:retinol dehydrogenase-13
LAHRSAKNGISFDDINFEKKNFKTMEVYGQSKLANILHAKELSRQLEGTGNSVYVLHPGVISTELGRHISDLVPKLLKEIPPISL